MALGQLSPRSVPLGCLRSQLPVLLGRVLHPPVGQVLQPLHLQELPLAQVEESPRPLVVVCRHPPGDLWCLQESRLLGAPYLAQVASLLVGQVLFHQVGRLE